MKRLARFVTVFAAGYGAHMVVAWYLAIQCVPEPDEEQTWVAGTDWIARTRGMFCGFGLSEMTDIQVVKTDGSDPIIIAKGSDVDQARLDGTIPQQLTISAPRDVDITPQPTKVPGLHIVWNRTMNARASH